MALHTDWKSFKSKVEQKRAHCTLACAHVAHELDARLCNIGALAEILCVNDAVVRVVRLGQTRELAACPVEFAGIDNHAAKLYGVPVEVLCRRMHDNVCAEFNRAAQHRRGKRIVHDERHAVFVCERGKPLDIKNGNRRIRYRFAEHRLRVRAERRLDFFVRCIVIHKCHVNSHLFHRNGKQVQRPAVDGRRADDVVAAAGNV